MIFVIIIILELLAIILMGYEIKLLAKERDHWRYECMALCDRIIKVENKLKRKQDA